MVSIIVPVYNGEHTIEKCINSLLNQTFDEIEIIIIDDGSIDKSLMCINKIARIDNRIKVISQNNRGVSNARNVGIKNSSGEFICFIDCDDWVGNDYIENLYKLITTTSSDLSVCGYTEVFNNINIEKIISKSKLNHDGTINGQAKDILVQIKDYINSPCLKLYKSSIIIENKLFFNEDMITAEDQDFNYQYLGYCQNISFINTANYYYNRSSSVLSKISNSKCFENELTNYEKKVLYFQKNKINRYEEILFDSVCYIVKRYSILSDADNTLYDYCDRINKIPIYHMKRKNKSSIKDEILYFMLYHRFYKPLHWYFRRIHNIRKHHSDEL